jgi:hypothetical protein
MTTELSAETCVRQARETVASLVDKRGLHERHLSDLARHRVEVSYEAHVGNPKARKVLDKIHAEILAAESEFLSLDAAITEAQRRLSAAEADLQRADEATRARQALTLSCELRSRGCALDAAVGALIEADREFRDAFRKLRYAGLPSEQLLNTVAHRSLVSQLNLETIPPAQRRTFTEIGDTYAATAESWAARRLDT